MKQPVIFTKKVPKGKAEGKLFCTSFEARNLEILPMNPPVPTSKIVFIMIRSKCLKLDVVISMQYLLVSLSGYWITP